MACCILGAMLMGQILHIWQLRRARMVRIASFTALSAVTLGVLVYQLHQHADHYLHLLHKQTPLAGAADPLQAMLADPALCCGDCTQLLATSHVDTSQPRSLFHAD